MFVIYHKQTTQIVGKDLKPDHRARYKSMAAAKAAITRAAQHLGRCTTEHVLQHLDMPVTRANEMTVAKQLRALGYTKSRVSIRGTQCHVFFPPQEAA